MKIALLPILIVLPWLSFAQESHIASASPSASDFVEALKASVKIGSVKCRVKMFHRDETIPMVTLDWAENKISYKFLYMEFDAAGKEVSWYSRSSGLDQSVEALNRGKYLSVRSTPEPIPKLVRNIKLPTALYEFIYNKIPDDAWKRTSARGLAMSSNWDSLLKRTKALGQMPLDGKMADVYQVSGGRDRFLGIPVSYRVYVNRDNLVPFAWKTFSKDGQLISEYEVKTFLPALDPNQKSPPLPAESTMRYYARSEDDIRKQPTNWVRLQYADVEIDGIPAEETIRLDFNSADFIADEEKQILTPVRK